jgi:hypothetical protein
LFDIGYWCGRALRFWFTGRTRKARAARRALHWGRIVCGVCFRYLSFRYLRVGLRPFI